MRIASNRPIALIATGMLLFSGGVHAVVCRATCACPRIDGQQEKRTGISFEIPAMGVLFRIRAWGVPADASDSIRESAAQRLEEIEQSLSHYRRDSELSELCRTAPHAQPVVVSRDLYCVLKKAKEIGDITDGAFDITIGPLADVWRMARTRNRLPDDAKIQSALESVGWQHVRVLNDGRVQLLRAGMKLDLGGIGKGYAADRLAQWLQHLGATAGIVDASGDLRFFGTRPPQGPWRIEIRSAATRGERIVTDESTSNEVPGGGPSQLVCLTGGAIATSGDLYQSLTIRGKRYSHILDPRTGWPTTQIRAVTVIAPDATTADAMASALTVMGARKGLALADRHPELAVRFEVRSRDGKVQIVTCRKWARYSCAKESHQFP